MSTKMGTAALSVAKQEQLKRRAVDLYRRNHQKHKPDVALYQVETNRGEQFVQGVMQNARKYVAVIALLAALASAFRTMQTVYEVYQAGGALWPVALLAAVLLALSAEGALFFLALAIEEQYMRWRQEKRKVEVKSLVMVVKAISRVISGWPDTSAKTWDQKAEGVGMLVGLKWAAFAFACAANAFQGLTPFLAEVGVIQGPNGGQTLHEFLAGLGGYTAGVQVKFVVEMFAVIFPPGMAMIAGMLTARDAARLVERVSVGQRAYEQDVAMWRGQYTDPMATEEWRMMYEALIKQEMQKRDAKAREAMQSPYPPSPMLADKMAVAADMTDSSNGDGDGRKMGSG